MASIKAVIGINKRTQLKSFTEPVKVKEKIRPGKYTNDDGNEAYHFCANVSEMEIQNPDGKAIKGEKPLMKMHDYSFSASGSEFFPAIAPPANPEIKAVRSIPVASFIPSMIWLEDCMTSFTRREELPSPYMTILSV